jgi:hypothetical protein
MMIGFVFSKGNLHKSSVLGRRQLANLMLFVRFDLRSRLRHIPRRQDANWTHSRVRYFSPYRFATLAPIVVSERLSRVTLWGSCYSDGRYLNGDGRLQRPSLAGEWKHDDVVSLNFLEHSRIVHI